jgi:hypothetical protein|tara:strand:- start:109 stop:381 length:273 start_codon:yes stop_codon:yes gene_type:complete
MEFLIDKERMVKIDGRSELESYQPRYEPTDLIRHWGAPHLLRRISNRLFKFAKALHTGEIDRTSTEFLESLMTDAKIIEQVANDMLRRTK